MIRRWTSRWRSEPLSCAVVREVISATLDGEVPGGAELAGLGTHLRMCGGCRSFLAAVTTLDGPVGLQAARPVPDSLGESLGREWVRTMGSSSTRSPRRWWQPSGGWQRAVQWTGALAPAAIVTIGLPLGALSSPHDKPTHVPTPCTARLLPDVAPSLPGSVPTTHP